MGLAPDYPLSRRTSVCSSRVPAAARACSHNWPESTVGKKSRPMNTISESDPITNSENPASTTKRVHLALWGQGE